MTQRLTALACFVLLLAGCNAPPPERNPLNAVGFAGFLRYSDGKPVRGVRLELVPFENADGYEGTRAEAVTDDDGNFTPSTEGVSRIYFGRYKVVVDPDRKLTATGDESRRPIPDRYRSAETTELQFDVTKKGARMVMLLIKSE